MLVENKLIIGSFKRCYLVVNLLILSLRSISWQSKNDNFQSILFYTALSLILNPMNDLSKLRSEHVSSIPPPIININSILFLQVDHPKNSIQQGIFQRYDQSTYLAAPGSYLPQLRPADLTPFPEVDCARRLFARPTIFTEHYWRSHSALSFSFIAFYGIAYLARIPLITF